MSVFDKIKEILDENKIEYKLKHHEPVYTSEQAAAARGDKLKQGAKAIIMKTDNGFDEYIYEKKYLSNFR